MMCVANNDVKKEYAQKNPNVRCALNIDCICGGKFIPFTHTNNNCGVTGYRCNKCGKDIIPNKRS